MRGILCLITLVLVLSVVSYLLWRHRTRVLSEIPAELDSYWDALKERRRFVRFKRKLAVECVVPEKAGNQYHTFSKDISGEGICLQVPEIMPEGSILYLRIDIPEQKPVAVKGEIVWVKESKGPTKDPGRAFSAGIKFLKVSEKDKHVLNSFLEQALGEDKKVNKEEV